MSCRPVSNLTGGLAVIQRVHLNSQDMRVTLSLSHVLNRPQKRLLRLSPCASRSCVLGCASRPGSGGASAPIRAGSPGRSPTRSLYRQNHSSREDPSGLPLTRTWPRPDETVSSRTITAGALFCPLPRRSQCPEKGGGGPTVSNQLARGFVAIARGELGSNRARVGGEVGFIDPRHILCIT
jgi:hypothetical protein